MLGSCNGAPDVPGTTKVINTVYGYVKYTADPGTYFNDHSRVKKMYCPCDPSFWVVTFGDYIDYTGDMEYILN